MILRQFSRLPLSAALACSVVLFVPAANAEGVMTAASGDYLETGAGPNEYDENFQIERRNQPEPVFGIPVFPTA